MSVVEVDNDYGGKSYLAPAGLGVEELPPFFLERLDPDDIAFHRDPIGSLDRMISRCEHPTLRSWLEALRESGYEQTEIHYCPPGRSWSEALRFANDIAITLPKVDPVGRVHPVLVPIYSTLGGVYRGAVEYSMCHLHSLPHDKFSNMGWIEESPSIDPDLCYSMVTELTGDVIGWHATDSRAVYCEHGKLSWLGPLSDIVENYFTDQFEDEDD